MSFLKKINAASAKFFGDANNIFLLVGTLFSAIAAVLVVSILVRLANFIPRGNGSYQIFYGLGNILVSAYGFSSILIPFFLVAASLCCFYKRANLKSAFLLLSSIAPFFTIAVTENICRAIFAEAGDRFLSVKLIFAIIIGVLLISIEVIGAIMLSDKFVEKVLGSNLFSPKSEPEPEPEEPVQFFSPIDGSIQPLDVNAKKKPDSYDLTKSLNEVLKKTQEATEKIEKYALQKEMVKPREESLHEAEENNDDADKINYYGEIEPPHTFGHRSFHDEEKFPIVEYEAESAALLADNDSVTGDEEAETRPVNVIADWQQFMEASKQQYTDSYAETAAQETEEDSDTEQNFSEEQDVSVPENQELQAESPQSVEAETPSTEDDLNEDVEPTSQESQSAVPEEQVEAPKISAAEQYPEYRNRERMTQSISTSAVAANANHVIEAEAEKSLAAEDEAENVEATTPDSAKDVFAQMEEDIRNELGFEEPRADFADEAENSFMDESEPDYDDRQTTADLASRAENTAVSESDPDDEVADAQEPEDFIDKDVMPQAADIDDTDMATEEMTDVSDTSITGSENSYATEDFTENAVDGFSDEEALSEGNEDNIDDDMACADDSNESSEIYVDSTADIPKVIPPKKTVTLPPLSASKKFTGKYEVGTDLLVKYEDDQYWVIDDETELAALALKDTLNEFNIEAQIIDIKKGPVVTMFEILPAPGVKLSKIVALQDNIALRLAASSVRIVAPIPGKRAVGIEIPNKVRSIVGFREIIELPLEEYGKMAVPVILGKDILGKPQVIDLVKTPHLLIAGATGAGKSVCVNSMILSILYKRSPNEVRLIMIDPKIVELKLYNDIPHLLTPVITEPKKAFQSLQYCLAEMERRYSLLDAMGVRDISSYNRRIEERKIATEKLPYIIVIIDEFADLMATTGKELEQTLARLAAMSRAVGIHLVLATQRPSIDVITGLIKANIPSRIAFMVASKMDSRIIIDQVGAEKLLGKGDMLYASAVDPFPVRIQGTFITDDEVESVVNAVKSYSEPDYIDDEIFIDDDDGGEQSIFDGGEDPLYAQALDVVLQSGKASASYIQRRLKIGYNRAARLVEEMELHGIVGPANGSKPREIIHVPS